MTVEQAIIHLSRILYNHPAFYQRADQLILDGIIRKMAENDTTSRLRSHPMTAGYAARESESQARYESMRDEIRQWASAPPPDPLSSQPTADPDPLTIEERLMVYEWARETYLDQMDGNYEYGLCAYIAWLIPLEYRGPGMIQRFFPELYAQKPDNRRSTGYWWPKNSAGSIRRIWALDKAAARCRDQIAAS